MCECVWLGPPQLVIAQIIATELCVFLCSRARHTNNIGLRFGFNSFIYGFLLLLFSYILEVQQYFVLFLFSVHYAAAAVRLLLVPINRANMRANLINHP